MSDLFGFEPEVEPQVEVDCSDDHGGIQNQFTGVAAAYIVAADIAARACTVSFAQEACVYDLLAEAMPARHLRIQVKGTAGDEATVRFGCTGRGRGGHDDHPRKGVSGRGRGVGDFSASTFGTYRGKIDGFAFCITDCRWPIYIPIKHAPFLHTSSVAFKRHQFAEYTSTVSWDGFVRACSQ